MMMRMMVLLPLILFKLKRTQNENEKPPKKTHTENKCNFNKSSAPTYVDFGKRAHTHNESHPFKWYAICYRMCYFCSHSSAFFDIRVYNSIDESFPCSLVLMCQLPAFNRIRVENAVLHFEHDFNEERRKIQQQQPTMPKRARECDGNFHSNHNLHHYRSYVHILYANLRSSFLLNVKYAQILCTSKNIKCTPPNV